MYTLEQGARRSAVRSREADSMSWTLDTIIKFHSNANEFSSCCERVRNIIVDRGRGTPLHLRRILDRY